MQSEAPFPITPGPLPQGEGGQFGRSQHQLDGESTQRCPKVLPLAGRYFPTVSELFGAVRENSGAFRNDARQFPFRHVSITQYQKSDFIDYQPLTKSFFRANSIFKKMSLRRKIKVGFFQPNLVIYCRQPILGHAMLQSCEASQSVERTPSVLSLNSTEKWQKALLIK